ncbi:MAG: ribonucleoside-diphosphate reductase subunit alpha [Lentisphaeria bacterium]|nr:ribonucleoside-diphosphate reductase subunit alpha [Lentisphaeria bacterium]
MLDQADSQLGLAGFDGPSNQSYEIRKRSGSSMTFEPELIAKAITKAFKAEMEVKDEEDLSPEFAQHVRTVTRDVVQSVIHAVNQGQELTVELVQDNVEMKLMETGFFKVARRYIVYREERKRSRLLHTDAAEVPVEPEAQMKVTLPDGSQENLDVQKLRSEIAIACKGFEQTVNSTEIIDEVLRMIYDGVRVDEIENAEILAAKQRVEKEPDYSFVAARLLLKRVYREALGKFEYDNLEQLHRTKFKDYLVTGVKAGRLSEKLLIFDIEKISNAIVLERDHKFAYMGAQTIYDRYLIHQRGRRIETPQYFWMRVAMGLAMNEGIEKEERAIEFYNVLSTFLFCSSTPTLFNSGTQHPQLSSCYLSTINDDLEHIFKVVSDDAKLSKWAGGLGNDWTPVRATGGYISGTNGESQGVIPFLKVANDTAVAVNQGGKRKGAMCAYLETWHLDIEDFLELRRNTGDERRRTHDMNTANWIPDLFMKRVSQEGSWTLFNPCEVPDLHDLYGTEFEKRYEEYEAMARQGLMEQYREVQALDLWRKMLSMLFETGHPWITFKDPSNVRSPQDHMGVVHSSNLCTEILLNTSASETAVCNLGSVNLPNHIIDGKINEKLVSRTVKTAMRMLDNVIDINFYPIPEARNANMRHRPVGLGIMGFQDALYKAGIGYGSTSAIDFADETMEMISYYAILSSSELASERGAYQSFKGSKWDKGQLPIDTLDNMIEDRGAKWLEVDKTTRLDWEPVRESIKKHGMRNSNTMAIAPTATISNIQGVSQSIEPTFKNLFAKSNLSGEFTTINTYLVEDLKRLGLWDEEMVEDLKYFDGSVLEIERIPLEIREKYITVFELDSSWIIRCASRRQKWIDMGQSLNLYIAQPSGKKLHQMYMDAWRSGLKTTYYLRSVAATQIEKSTVDINKRGIQPRWMKNKSASSDIVVDREPAQMPKACSILDPDCEACQ